MGSNCKNLQAEVLKDIRDNISNDVNLLKESRDIMQRFKESKINTQSNIYKNGDMVYAEQQAKAMNDYVDNNFVDVTPSNTYLDFAFNGRGMTQSSLIKKAVYNKENKTTEVTLSSNNKFTFQDGARISKSSKAGHYITLNAPLYEYGIDTYMYGSQQSKMNQESTFTKMARGIHKDIGKMKELLYTLNTLDNVKATDSHLTHLSSLFDMINPKFLKDVDYFLNTEAKDNGGMVQGKELKLNLKNSNRKAANEQSAAEIYAHEVLHTLVGYANKSIDPEVVRIKRDIYHVMNIARKSVQAKHLVPKDSLTPEEDLKIANQMLSYVFNNKDSKSIDEFISHGLTNELFVARLKEVIINSNSNVGPETLLDKLTNLVREFFERVFNRGDKTLKGKDAYTNLLELTLQLSEYNNRSINKARTLESASSKIYRLMDSTNGLINKAFEAVSSKLFGADKDMLPAKPSKDASKFEFAKYYAKLAPKIVSDPRLRGVFQTALSGLGMSPEGIVQNIIRDFKDPTKLERTIEALGGKSDTIDRIRQTMIKSVQDSIMEGFTKKLSNTKQEAITTVILELDIEGLKGKYTNIELSKLLTNEVELNKRISRAKNELKELDRNNYNWHVNQANGLGYYLATHKAGIAQNLNSLNIARGLLSETYKTPSKALVQKLDEVSTLVGMKYTNKKDKIIVAELLKTESKGIDNIVAYHKGFKKESTDKLFKTSQTNVIKGYIKEIFDDSIDIKVVPLSQDSHMREQGYTFVSEVAKHSRDKNHTPMAMYKSKLGLTRQYYRSATRLTNIARKGMSLTDIRMVTSTELAVKQAKRDIAVMNQTRRTIVQDMLKGELDVEAYAKDIGMVPLMNPSGKVVDYRYMMSKENKEEILDQDKKIGKTLGGMIGAVYDKVETEVQNEATLAVILEDMKDNYIPGLRLGKNNHEYIKIAADSDIAKFREIYQILPDKMKAHIQNTDNKYIAVRRDMVHNYFGFRHASILDLGYGSLTLESLSPPMLKRIIHMVELIWKEVIKLVKIDILVKIPEVMISNVISNIMLSVTTEGGLIKVLKTTFKNIKNVREYINLSNEVIELELAKASGNILKKDIGKINTLKERMKASPIAELDEAGMFQSIVEEVSQQDYESSNKIVGKIDEYLDHVPEFVRTGVNWLYLTEKTSYFTFMNQIVQYSDLVARATHNDLMKEKGIAKDVRMNTVLDSFINYNKPASSTEEYLNQMGLLMFTKYMKRIQRVLKKMVSEKPLNTFLAISGQELIYDIDDVTDQFALTRSYKNLDQSMIDQMLGILTPASYQLVTGNK